MRRFHRAFAISLCLVCCFLAANSWGGAADRFSFTADASPAPLPGDQGGAPPPDQAAPDDAESYVSLASADPAPGPDPGPWKIPQLCILQQMGINMGGWLQQGITFNNLRPADGFNGPVSTNDLDRQYQMNQFWVYFVKPTKTDGCGFDIGGRIDVVEGTDWRFGQSFGLETTFDDPNSFYGLILPQFYLEVAINDLTFKLGHFATFTSYEVIPPILNFFYSHSYLMAGYFDPLLVTGLQGEYKLGDNWTAIGGINRGWMQFEDPTDSWNFLGGLKWTDDEKRSTLSLMCDTGPQLGFTGLHERDSVYLVYTYQLTKKWLYASQYDIGQEKNGSFVTPGQNANWYGTEQMLVYTLNKKWALGLRYEWVRDEEGSRIAGIGNVLLTDKGWNGKPGFTGSFHDVSVGLNYRPHPNFVLRPEVRWDAYDGPRNPFGEYPFGDFENTYQFTAAVDLLFTF